MAMKQKFLIGFEVEITNDMPQMMSHFTCGCNAIVMGTYSQLCRHYGEDDLKKYKLLLLDKDGKPFNSSAWYYEDQLTLVLDDMKKGMELMESFYLR